jgi:hypothetical protein
MIHVIFSPGSYGSYVMQSIYAYSNLSQSAQLIFNNITGDSHNFRNSDERKRYFNQYHLSDTDQTNFYKSELDKVVCIIPDTQHNLDFFCNQLLKQEKGNLINYILKHEPLNVINDKLTNFWNYQGEFSNNVPIWILREWFSFWISDCWKNGYNAQQYIDIKSDISIQASELFNTEDNIFVKIIESIGLKVVASNDIMKENIQKFVSLQKFHNSQNRCDLWVKNLLQENIHSQNPCNNILEEAYVQYKLRENNIEIYCDQLKVFPKTTIDMLRYLYKI